MAFWISIILAAAGAYLAYKRCDFYRMWAIAFNILIAIYLSIMLSPWIISMIPEGTPGLQYQKVACILAIAILVFGILQAITVNFITKDNQITFPKLFDSIGSSCLGFIAGWFISSFLLLMICIMPISKKPFMNNITGQKASQKLAIAPVTALCDFITFVSIQPSEDKPNYVINELVNPKLPDEEETDQEDEIEIPKIRPKLNVQISP